MAAFAVTRTGGPSRIQRHLRRPLQIALELLETALVLH